MRRLTDTTGVSGSRTFSDMVTVPFTEVSLAGEVKVTVGGVLETPTVI